MLNVTKKTENTTLIIAVEGRLDTVTAPELEKEIKNSLDGITQIEFDFEKLEYISSAGLRVLLLSQKSIRGQKPITIKNVNDSVFEVLEVTGFVDILNVVKSC